MLHADLYSNKSLVLQFEMLARDLEGLMGRLQAAGVTMSPKSTLRASQLAAKGERGRDELGSGPEVMGTLEVTLTAGGPDVSRVAPSVPG